jgi:hypothetical protein
MDPQSEVIRDRIEDTRESLTQKLEALEGHVKGTVENVRAKVEGAVDAVTDTVKSTVAGVKRTFDIPEHIRRHPLAMVGGAFALGAVLAWVTTRRRWYTPEPYWSSAPEPDGRQQQAPPNGRQQQAPSGPSWFANILTPLTEELDKVKATGLGMLFGLAREALERAAPESVAPRVREIVDDMTRRAGATVVPSPVLGGGHCSSTHTDTP